MQKECFRLNQLSLFDEAETDLKEVRRKFFQPQSRGHILTDKFYNDCNINQKINCRANYSFPHFHWHYMLAPNYFYCTNHVRQNNFDTPFIELWGCRKLKHD